MPSGLPRIDHKTGFLLAVVVAIAILVSAWDWNWFRHLVENYYIKRSHREVRIGDLDISFNGSLEPTVRLRGLYVQNASWADDRPFVTAHEVSFTFALRSIAERRPIVSRLVLVDADVDLERQADGHRNWRLRNPENVARGRLKVIRLDARNTRIRFVRRDTDLEVVASAEALEPPSRNAGGELTKRVLFEGKLKGIAFAGSADTSDVLTIIESGALFPIRGHMQTDKARMDVDGSVADLFRPSKAIGEVHVKGTSLADLHPFTRDRLADSKPFDFQAQLDQEGDALSLRKLRMKVGSTLLTGVASLDRTLDPPLLKAALRSEAADLDDLASSSGRPSRRPETAAPPSTKVGDDAPGRLFSGRGLHFDRLRKLDAELSLHLKKLRSKDFPGLESFSVVAELKDAVLRLTPNIGIAEGNLRGTARVDARKQPATVELKLAGRDIRIEKLLVGHRIAGTTAGPVKARIDVTSRGDSVQTIAANLDGTAALTMENGVISHLADAVLELDPARAVQAVISGNGAIGINRVDVEFDFSRGRGSARNIFIDTAQTRMVGTGSFDLRDETLDIVLTPRPKSPGILALDSAIRMSGAIRKPQLSLVKKSGDERDRETDR